MGKLTIFVYEGRNLIAGDRNGKSDPYAIVYLKAGITKKQKTKTIKKTLDPQWNENFLLESSAPESEILVIEVFDWDRIGKDDPLGYVEYPLSNLEKQMPFEGWLTLNGVAHGEVRVKLVAEDFGPLPTQLQQQQQQQQHYQQQYSYPPQAYYSPPQGYYPLPPQEEHQQHYPHNQSPPAPQYSVPSYDHGHTHLPHSVSTGDLHRADHMATTPTTTYTPHSFSAPSSPSVSIKSPNIKSPKMKGPSLKGVKKFGSGIVKAGSKIGELTADTLEAAGDLADIADALGSLADF